MAGRSDSGISGDRNQPNQGRTDYWLVHLTTENHQGYQKATALQQPSVITASSTEQQIIPVKSAHFKTYPNPFPEHLSIKVAIPARQYISLKVYDIQGREVSALFEGIAEADKVHSYEWVPKSYFSPGVYLIRLVTPDSTLQQKVLFTP